MITSNMETNMKDKKRYTAPTLEVFEFEVEQGFAASPVAQYNNEALMEITDRSGEFTKGGEWETNNSGSWF